MVAWSQFCLTFAVLETIAVKKLVETHNFTIAFNFHSYGHLMLLPYSCRSQHLARMDPKDRSYFVHYGKMLVYHSKYKLGRAYDKAIKLYPVNGDAADWMYNKHGIIAVSPEVGGRSFWVPPNQVVPLSKENIPICTYGALAAGPLLRVMNLTLTSKPGNESEVCVEFVVRNDGLWSSSGKDITAFLVVQSAEGDAKNFSSKLPRALAKLTHPSSSFKQCFLRDYSAREIRVGSFDKYQCVSYVVEPQELLSGSVLSLEEARAYRSDTGTSMCPGSTAATHAYPIAPTRQRREPLPPLKSKDTDSPIISLVLLFSTIVLGCFCGIHLHRNSDVHKYDSLQPEEIESMLDPRNEP